MIWEGKGNKLTVEHRHFDSCNRFRSENANH